MKKIHLIIFLIVALLIAGGIYYAVVSWIPSGEETTETPLKEEISREEIIKDVSERINEISPIKPVLGGKWYVLRFWFLKNDNENFYVEYEDGHIMSKFLAEAKKKNETLNYAIIGVFEPGEVDWRLTEGEDKFFGQSLDLYEYSEELEKWIKKN